MKSTVQRIEDLKRTLDFWETYGRNDYPASEQPNVERRISAIKQEISDLQKETGGTFILDAKATAAGAPTIIKLD